MNEKLAFKKLNQLFISVRRMKVSIGINEQGITPREKKYIMDSLREISQTIKR